MTRSHFHVGDWVRTNKLIPGVPVGTAGRVKLVFWSVDETYDVVFSGHEEPSLVFGPQLEFVQHAA